MKSQVITSRKVFLWLNIFVSLLFLASCVQEEGKLPVKDSYSSQNREFSSAAWNYIANKEFNVHSNDLPHFEFICANGSDESLLLLAVLSIKNNEINNRISKEHRSEFLSSSASRSWGLKNISTIMFGSEDEKNISVDSAIHGYYDDKFKTDFINTFPICMYLIYEDSGDSRYIDRYWEVESYCGRYLSFDYSNTIINYLLE